MIRNFKHFKAIITYDSRLSEIRLIQGEEIKFIKLSNSDNNLFNSCNDDKFFISLLRDVINENGFLCSLSLIQEVKV
jgi:hypothetical protein